MLNVFTKYIYEVYRSKSVSVAAEKLFVSQPALSSAIKKAEIQLGFEIFNRKTLPFSLTDEGKVYIEAIEKIMNIEKESEEKIADIKKNKSGTIKIATATHLSFFVIPKILEFFHQEHPQIDISIVFENSDKLVSLLENESVNLIFTVPQNLSNDFSVVPLFEEKNVIAIPKRNIHNYKHIQDKIIEYNQLIDKSYDKNKIITDYSVFKSTEFIYSPPKTGIHKKRKLFFGKSDFTPYITSNAGRQQLNYNLMRAGFGAFLTTDANIATMQNNNDCVFFVLDDYAMKESFSIVYLQNKNNAILENFIESAKNIFNCDAPLKILK